jgi:cell division protein FtsQ
MKPVPSNRRLPKEASLPDVLEERAPAAPPPAPNKATFGRAVAALRMIAGVALVLGISGTVAWGARKYVKSSPRFAVSEIVVTGGRLRTADQITDQAGIKKGANVFALDLDVAKHNLLEDPWIFEAQLARRLPGTVYVQVTEREAGALVALGDMYLVARDGEIFKRLELGDPIELPIVTGVTQEAVAEDRDGVKQTLRRAIDLAGDYDRSPLGQKAPLQEIHVGADGAVTLVVGKSALQLALGEPPYRKKIDEAARVLAELDRRGAKADAILLDNEARPERVVVRMR